MLPEQGPAQPALKEIISEDIYNFGPSTNLVALLENIRDLSKKEQFDKAQKMATAALEKIAETEQNNYYLRQIKREETKLYFSRANQAMREKSILLPANYCLVIAKMYLWN